MMPLYLIGAAIAFVIVLACLLAVWSLLPLMVIIVFGLALVFAIMGFVYLLTQDKLDRAAKREILLGRLEPDKRGNYPAIYLPNGQIIQLEPGNPGNPPVQNFIVSNGNVAAVPRQRNPYERPLVVNTGGYRLADTYEHQPTMPTVTVSRVETDLLPETGEKQPEMLEQPQSERAVSAFQAFQDETFQDFTPLLEMAKREGRAKRDAIPAITGVKPGGSKAWADYSKVWDAIEVQ